ncbi:BlaI/MecI/CopY family transcriptional regulator [candidate division KSB1 bacterium]
MLKKQNKLSKNEWNIMNICWDKGEVPARVVYDETLKIKKRSYQTIKTTLDRLVEKGYLKTKRLGSILLFRPVMTRKKVLSQVIDNFVSTMLDNTLNPIIAHFAKKGKLRQEDIEALEELIRKSKEK